MTVLYVFIIILALLIMVISMIPGEYNIEDAVIIRKAVAEVKDKVADLRFYSQWSSLKIMESGSKVEISGIPKMAGHSCRWQSKKAGAGNVTIRAIDERHIHFDLNILTWKLTSKDNWFFEEWGDGETKITLQNNGNVSLPFAKFMKRIIIKKLHLEISRELNNLKNLCEKITP